MKRKITRVAGAVARAGSRVGAGLPARRVASRALALVLAAVFLIGGLAQARIETGADSFLPANDPSMEQFEEFSASFGGDPIVVLLESEEPRGLLAEDQLPKVLSLEGRLTGLDDVARVYGAASTLNQIAGQAQRLLAELTGRRDGLEAEAQRTAEEDGASEEEIAEAGEAAVADFDQRYGSLIVQGLPVGLPTLHNREFVQNVLFNNAGEPRAQWSYVVPEQNALAVLVRPREGLDQEATERVVAQVEQAATQHDIAVDDVTVAGGPTIASAVGERASVEIPYLGAAAIAAIGLALFFVPWTERRRRRLLPLGVTVLATGLTVAVLGWLDRPISLGVVAFLPVLAGVGSYYTAYFVRRARTRTVFAVGAATAASFATLALSPLPFVADLGLTLALGVALAVSLGWVAARLLAPPGEGSAAGEPDAGGRDLEAGGRDPEALDSADVDSPDGDSAARDSAAGDSAASAGSGGSGAAQAGASVKSRLVAASLAGLVAVGGWAALPGLPLQTNVAELTEGLEATEDAEHVEDVIGSSAEFAVVLDGDNVLTPEAWDWMRTAQESVITGAGDQLAPVLSPPALMGFLGQSPEQTEIQAAHRLMPQYLTGSVIRGDTQQAVLSYGVNLDDLEQVEELTTGVGERMPAAPEGYEVALTGLSMVAVRGYELISGDRYLLGLAGVFAATTVLLLSLRRRSDALRAGAAAVLATGAALLILAATGTPLNPITVALGSLTAAVACEFTVMLAESVRRGERGLRTVVLLATLTSAAGFAALGLSQLAVMQQFGLLLTLSVGLSYLAARFVVWAWPAGAAPSLRTEPAANPALVGGTR